MKVRSMCCARQFLSLEASLYIYKVYLLSLLFILLSHQFGALDIYLEFLMESNTALSKPKAVWMKCFDKMATSDRVFRSGLKINQSRSRYVFTTCYVVEINVDPF